MGTIFLKRIRIFGLGEVGGIIREKGLGCSPRVCTTPSWDFPPKGDKEIEGPLWDRGNFFRGPYID